MDTRLGLIMYTASLLSFTKYYRKYYKLWILYMFLKYPLVKYVGHILDIYK